MPPLDAIETYEPCVQEPFLYERDSGPALALVLTRAERKHESPHRRCFSLTFEGPDEYLRQGSYRLRHARLGEVDLFLVPVGKTGHGFQYQSVFNLLLT
jgi:hypothetical protein